MILAIEIDHMSLTRLNHGRTLLQKTIINRNILWTHLDNSFKALKLYGNKAQKLSKNFKVPKRGRSTRVSLKTPSNFYIQVLKSKEYK